MRSSYRQKKRAVVLRSKIFCGTKISLQTRTNAECLAKVSQFLNGWNFKNLNNFPNIILNVNECEPINPCAHVCVDKPIGYECRCNAGFKPNPKDAHLCSDIDECSEHPKPCSQICRNTFGSYNCSCTDGYLPIHNGHSCKTNSSKKSKSFF